MDRRIKVILRGEVGVYVSEILTNRKSPLKGTQLRPFTIEFYYVKVNIRIYIKVVISQIPVSELKDSLQRGQIPLHLLFVLFHVDSFQFTRNG